MSQPMHARLLAGRGKRFLLCCLLLLLGACSARTFDTGSEAGLIAAFEHHTGERWNADDHCYDDIAELGIVLYAHFAHDVGCTYHSLLLSGEQFGDVRGMRPHVFALNGWEDVAQRQGIVRLWVEQVRTDPTQVLRRVDEPFARHGYAFEPFSAELQPDNSVIARYWVQRLGGMLPATGYALYETHFSADGNDAATEQLASFVAYLDPLEDATHILEGEWQHQAQIEDGLATFETISFSDGRFTYYAYPPLSAQGIAVLAVDGNGTISADLHTDGQLWRTLTIEPEAGTLKIDDKRFTKVVEDE